MANAPCVPWYTRPKLMGLYQGEVWYWLYLTGSPRSLSAVFSALLGSSHIYTKAVYAPVKNLKAWGEALWQGRIRMKIIEQNTKKETRGTARFRSLY